MPDIHALTFNAITRALSEADWFVPLSVREAVAAAVEAAIEPGIRADERERCARGEPALPTVAQIRVWLLAHGWTPGSPGVAGTLWHPPNGGHTVGVPDSDEDSDEDASFTAGAISRIADRGGHFVDEVIREMLAGPIGS